MQKTALAQIVKFQTATNATMTHAPNVIAATILKIIYVKFVLSDTYATVKIKHFARQERIKMKKEKTNAKVVPKDNIRMKQEKKTVNYALKNSRTAAYAMQMNALNATKEWS